MSGFYIMQRGWRDHPVFKGEFSRGDAWGWLIENACWRETTVKIGGQYVELQRGELSFSVRFMATKWEWSKSRVDRFLAELRHLSMIETRTKNGTGDNQKTGQGQVVICICNYAKYQDVGTDQRDNVGTDAGTKLGQQRDKEEPLNQLTIEEEAKASPSKARAKVKFILPDWVPVEPWDGYVAMRARIKKPLTDHAKGLAVDELTKLAEDGHPPGPVLNQSTFKNYLGLFPIKDQRNANIRKDSGSGTGQIDRRDGFERACDRLIQRSGGEVERPATGRDGGHSHRALASPDPLR